MASKADLERKDEGNNIIKVRCPVCGILLTYINPSDQRLVRRSFHCKKCGNQLLVLVNPVLVQQSISSSE